MKLKLTDANINMTCGEAEAFLTKRNTDSKERIRTIFSLEETLLKYKNAFGSDSEFFADFGSGFRRNLIRLSVPGGMTASFTILFAQLALPVTNIAIILSLTSILDFPVTAADMFSGQCVLALASKDLDK